MKPVRCPNCQLRWNIRDDMPPFFTCPRCLKTLKNPYPSIAFPETPANPPPLPRRVIPVERQTGGDMRIAMIGLVIVVIAIGAGIVTLLLAGVNGEVQRHRRHRPAPLRRGLRRRGDILTKIQNDRLSHARRRSPFPRRAIRATSNRLSAPRRRHRKTQRRRFFAQTIVGIITGIVAMVLLAMLGGFPALAAPAIGIALMFHPKWRGFGLGLLLAFPVAFLLLLGFCAIMLGGSGWHG